MEKRTLWYTLGEAAKATNVRRTRLDHACRVGRLQYRRSEDGARLLSHDVIEKLRKDGLKAFPRPYDPIASPKDQEVSPSGATAGAGLTAQRERVDQKRGELEEMRVNRDLRQLKEQEQQEKAERRAAGRSGTADTSRTACASGVPASTASPGRSTPSRSPRASCTRSRGPRAASALGSILAGSSSKTPSIRCSPQLRVECPASRCRASSKG